MASRIEKVEVWLDDADASNEGWIVTTWDHRGSEDQYGEYDTKEEAMDVADDICLANGLHAYKLSVGADNRKMIRLPY